jgi:hypothetical protein
MWYTIGAWVCYGPVDGLRSSQIFAFTMSEEIHLKLSQLANYTRASIK